MRLCVPQGAVQGPEEFAEGFVIGVRSLLGHTVGKRLALNHNLWLPVSSPGLGSDLG